MEIAAGEGKPRGVLPGVHKGHFRMRKIKDEEETWRSIPLNDKLNPFTKNEVNLLISEAYLLDQVVVLATLCVS